MEKPTITRRTFLKASAIAGVAAAVVSPGMLTLKGLSQGRAAAPAEEKVFHSGCRACHTNCNVLAHVRDGRVVKVEGDKSRGAPNFGRACLRAFGSVQWLYSPTRIKYPLKRVGQRGEGKWQRISWDQAMDEIAPKLKEVTDKYGAESIGFPGRTGRHDLNMIENRLAYSLNTPNKHWGSGEHCYIIRNCVGYCTFGSGVVGADVANAALRFNWGLEGAYSRPTTEQGKADARWDKGQKVVHIDPTFSPTASISDLWLPVRPGTDPALELAMINVIITENLYAEAFVKTWTNGAFLATCEENSYKVRAYTSHQTGENKFDAVKQNVGSLLTEADIKEGGSPRRYLFWNKPTNDIRYWDAEEIQWQGGPSGKGHFQNLVSNCKVGKPFSKPPAATDINTAANLPAGVDPALLGTYTVTLKDGKQVQCKPAFQHLADIAADYAPEKSEKITWVPAAKVRQAARMFATIKPATIDEGVAFDQQTNSSQMIRGKYILQMITGNIDNMGGGVISPFWPVQSLTMWTVGQETHFWSMPIEQRRKGVDYYNHPIYCGGVVDEDMGKIMPFPWNIGWDQGVMDNTSVTGEHVATVIGKPYPIKAYITLGVNPLMHDPDVNYLMEGLKKLDLHVNIDILMTPTSEMADYVFPGLTWFERPYLSGSSTYAVNAYEKSIEPLWESRHDYQFGAMIAKRMGRAADWEGETQEEWYDARCKRDLGISWADMVKRLSWQMPTPPPPAYNKYQISGTFGTYTRKAELYSTIFKKWGYPPLLTYAEPGYSAEYQPEMAKQYPLILSTGKRQAGWFHSEFRMVPWLREIVREPWLFITPKDAEPLGIKDGDWVWIESPVGKCMNKAVVTEGLLPGVVVNAQHAWWRPEKSAQEDMHGAFEWNIGCVVQAEYHDPESGSSPLKCQLCKVYKATQADIDKYKPEITLEQLKGLLPLEEV